MKRILLTVSAALLAAASQAAPPAREATEAFGIRGPATAKSAKPAPAAPSHRLGLDLVRVPLIALSTVDNDALRFEDELGDRGPGPRTKVLRYGIGRDVAVAALDGAWTELPDGARLWAAEVVSPTAIGLRLHLADVQLPAGAQLAIYGADDVNPPELYSGSPVTKTAFWSGTVIGERARVEYLAPAGSPDELPFRIDRLQHLYRDPVAELTMAKAAGSCNNDVSCFPDWVDLSRAVSGVGFIGSNSLFCTGQLLNVSGKPDFSPYWLSANHCLDTQGDAESAEFYWNYQTSSCNGAPPSIGSVQRSLGATLVSTNPLSDYTLLMVEGALPADQLFWAGWTSKEPGNGADAVAIHHPSGDFKRISFGFKEPVNECFQFPGFAGRKLVRTTWTGRHHRARLLRLRHLPRRHGAALWPAAGRAVLLLRPGRRPLRLLRLVRHDLHEGEEVPPGGSRTTAAPRRASSRRGRSAAASSRSPTRTGTRSRSRAVRRSSSRLSSPTPTATSTCRCSPLATALRWPIRWAAATPRRWEPRTSATSRHSSGSGSSSTATRGTTTTSR
jgi:hypothetical protein